MITATKELGTLAGSQGFRNAWRAVFNTPEFVMLFSAMRKACQVSDLPQQVVGVHHDTTIAHHFHYLKGNNEVLDFMEKLAKGEIDIFDPIQTEEFSHITDQAQ